MASGTLCPGGCFFWQHSVVMALPVTRVLQTARPLARHCNLHVTPAFKKAKTGAEQRWLARQTSDPYVKAAQANNYRCRSAFKLLEIDSKYKLLLPGHSVIDCGAAPGAWSQVVVQKVNSLGTEPNVDVGFVVGVDLLHVSPLEGAVFLSDSDITDPVTQNKVVSLLPTGKADVVLSDMAPNASGIRELDHQKLVNMCLSLLDLTERVLRPGGSFLCKLWDGGKSCLVRDRLRQRFQDVRNVKPKASRTDSAETYLLARFHKGDPSPAN
ncbi:rRNA methyltransferase 2, mitochondrial [Spea bombifrons]|uniref:rRNA methyltransferase 2, mitochondrial n=1 Tax=Spea bombifrons TaxID=233779 RepID=UPI00234A5E91|nr:rRNA methyltransferase 2, mitochondrial [Spea bombifrons]